LITFLYALFSLHHKMWVRFFIVWIVVGWVLSFMPFGIARFFLRGLYFPMAALAVYAIEAVAQRYRVRKQVLYITYTAVSLLTIITIFHLRIANVSAINYWTYMSLEEAQAVRFLQTQKDVRVLANYYMSNHIPAWTGATVYAGHKIQTPQAGSRLKLSNAFYAEKWNNKKARSFLLTNHITHVYYGTVEKMLGTMPPYPFLKIIYQKGGVTIYRVT
ncbi:MAG: hypothetical protein NUV52_01240, partial [Candidatus Roizmanbacteria bacterium]|nr:hypothetical protein [Candidatus Roizmanbacteria bacterium]